MNDEKENGTVIHFNLIFIPQVNNYYVEGEWSSRATKKLSTPLSRVKRSHEDFLFGARKPTFSGMCELQYLSEAKWEIVTFVFMMYSCGPPHMAVQNQDDQHEHTFNNYVRIRDVVQKTCLRRWTIGKSGERGSGISALPKRHDDDEDSILNLFYFKFLSFFFLVNFLFNPHKGPHLWTK